MTRRKDGRWQAALTIDGKKRYFCGRTQKEVMQKIAAYKEKKERGRTFAEVCDEWQEEHFDDLQPSTIKGYLPSVKRACDEFSDEPIKDIAPMQIDALLRKMKEQKYCRKTVSTQLSVLMMIFDHAVLKEDVQINPCARLRVPKGLPSQGRDIASDEDITAILASNELMPLFLLLTGVRRGELLALRWEDVDREKKTLSVNKSVGYNYEKPFIKTPKTAAGTRIILLPDKLLAVLPNRKQGLIFPSKQGELMTQTQFRREWISIAQKLGLSCTPHQLRHAYATLLLEADVDAKDAQKQLGHSSVQITQNIYTHIREQRAAKTANKLNAYVNSMANTR